VCNERSERKKKKICYNINNLGDIDENGQRNTFNSKTVSCYNKFIMIATDWVIDGHHFSPLAGVMLNVQSESQLEKTKMFNIFFFKGFILIFKL
jgi:hypothetical protein